MTFFAVLNRDIRLSLSNSAGLSLGAVFYLSLVILFPFGIGPDLPTLQLVGPAILWAGPLLSILLSVENVFQPDLEDGTMDIYRMSDMSAAELVLAKSVSTWLTSAIPLILLSPLFGMMLGMQRPAIMGSFISLLVGSPALVFFAVFSGALTAEIRRAGMLTAILAVPFLIPTLIFGVSAAVGYSSASQPFTAPILILCALSLLSPVLCIWGSAVIISRLRPS